MDIKKIIDINPSSFFPIPKIKSTLLIFKPKNNFYKINNPKNLEHITNIFFSGKRKMINKPLARIFKNHISVSKRYKIDLNLRPSDLSLDQYYKLAEHYESD